MRDEIKGLGFVKKTSHVSNKFEDFSNLFLENFF
jgi:hypothetical protein